MKSIILSILTLALIFSFGCMKKAVTKTKEAELIEEKVIIGDDILNIIPKQIQGLIFLNVQKSANTRLFDKLIALGSEKTKNHYNLIKELGIDIKKDVHFLTVANSEKFVSDEESDVIVVVNLKYDKDLILSNLKEMGLDNEEDYQNVTIYSENGERSEEIKLAILNETYIAYDDENLLKAVIDLSQDKGENIYKNENMKTVLKNINKEAFLWGGYLIPEEAIEKAIAKNPLVRNLELIEATSFFVDYDNSGYFCQINLVSEDETKNKQIVEFINLMKLFYSMGTKEDNDIQALIENINVSVEPTGIKITFKTSEDLLIKLIEKS